MPRRGDGVMRPRPACYRCFKPAVACICGSIERVDNRTGIIILQHPRERFHPVGTARIARLGLAKVRLEACAPWTENRSVRDGLPEGSALLYPAAGARDLAALAAEERPRHLVVLDGTWFHAGKMYEAHAWVRDLPHVRLTPREPSGYRVRRQPREEYVATVEAIVAALRILEPRTRGLDGLLRSFSAMVERQAAYVADRPPARRVIDAGGS
jgi:DTW domain-containing protein YfiP